VKFPVFSKKIPRYVELSRYVERVFTKNFLIALALGSEQLIGMKIGDRENPRVESVRQR